ncbi:DUF4124 domain-containing protein [Gilvimarinus xylanilyticus]|uniref:DUF4124 domain-containing protein n=1 Tax=Gilvimarinus xylanilyticus TaxID=2944139 RepID=A0A9X2HWC0_9GAMM|nr:DUF4124 domain-containing protein [Gilvimarinus xylanilyticus]MCP8899598.1 DUF4124 domain-containing protein [Gilvimarinus xylanilyticus]
MRLCLIFLIFLGVPAAAQLYQWTDENGRTHYSDKPPPGQQAEAPVSSPSAASTSANEPTLVSRPAIDPDDIAYSRPAYSETLYLRHLLRTGEYSQLNNVLQAGLEAVERDNSQDFALRTAYYAFKVPTNEMLQALNAWVAASPESYQAYIARAMCRYARGWSERGNRFISDTSRDQIAGMEREFAHAYEDVEQALALNNRAIVAYYLITALGRSGSDQEKAYSALVKANYQYPQNYIVRRGYILGLSPRWGGSWQEIQDFVAEVPVQDTGNPKLKELAGYESFEKGALLYLDKEYQAAIEAFDQSLESGPNPVAYAYRGRAYYRLDKDRLAIDDLTKAIYLRPDYADQYYWRSQALYYFGRYADALADIERAYALDPTDEYIQKFRQRLFRNYGHPELKNADNGLAQAMIEKEVPKYDVENQFKQGLAYLALRENEAAEAVFRRLTQLKPENMEYARWLDFALFRQARLDDIVAFWDDVIARYPDNAVAYSERAGTFYHLEQYYRALDSARMAEKLGDPEAAEFIERLVALTTRPESGGG